MAFLLIGLILLAMKLAEVGPGAEWSWWLVLAPFGLAAVWWHISDSLGLTSRREMNKLEARAETRRRRAFDALWQGKGGSRGGGRRR